MLPLCTFSVDRGVGADLDTVLRHSTNVTNLGRLGENLMRVNDKQTTDDSITRTIIRAQPDALRYEARANHRPDILLLHGWMGIEIICVWASQSTSIVHTTEKSQPDFLVLCRQLS